jgi:hypothetical protein
MSLHPSARAAGDGPSFACSPPAAPALLGSRARAPAPPWRRRRAARNLACRERCRGWIARHEYSYRRWRGPARPPGVGGHAGGESALAGDLRQGDLTRQGDLSPLKIRHKLGPGIARRTTPIICCREDPAVSLSFSVVRPDRGPPNSDRGVGRGSAPSRRARWTSRSSSSTRVRGGTSVTSRDGTQATPLSARPPSGDQAAGRPRPSGPATPPLSCSPRSR